MKQKRYLLGLLLLACCYTWAAEVIMMPVEKITQCKDAGSYIWRDSLSYNESGTYHDSVWEDTTKVYVYTLKLEMKDQFEKDVILELEKGKTIEYGGYIFDKPGTKDITIYGDPCNTIEHVKVNYKTYYELKEKKHLCGDTVLVWHGDSLRESGTYQHISGDTTYTLVLTITLTPPSIYESKHSCIKAEPFTWHGLEIKQPCDTFVTIPAKTGGCDTIAYLHYFVVAPLDTTFLPDSIVCGSKPYDFHGKQYYGDLTLSDRYTSIYGCDSIVARRFISEPGTYVFLNDSNDFAKNPNYHWSATGKYYNQAGLYLDSVESTGSCKKLFQLKLAEIIHDSLEYCQGQTASYEGQPVTTNKTFKKITYTEEGWMDKVLYTHFIFNAKNVEKFEDVTIGHEQSHLWHYDRSDTTLTWLLNEANGASTSGKTYTKQIGDNPCNQASIKVKVTPYQYQTHMVIRSIEACKERDTSFIKPSNNERVIVRQNSYGTLHYYDTVRNEQGHGTLYSTFTFVCTQKVSHVDSILYCTYPEPIYVNGQKYTKYGVYEQAITGSDSIYRFALVEYHYPQTQEVTLEGCYLNLPLQAYGYKFYQSSDTTLHFKYQPYDCDTAVINLHVRISNRQRESIDTGFCAGKFFVLPWLKDTIYQPGSYYDTIPNTQSGCDSIVPYHLQLWDSPRHTTTLCAKQGVIPVPWTITGGKDTTISIPGTYISTFPSKDGCDSLSVLHLLENRTYAFYDTLEMCSNETYIWHGKEIKRIGNNAVPYVDDSVHYTTACCQNDSAYYLHMIVHDTIKVCNQIPLWEGSSYLFHGWKLTLDSVDKTFSAKVQRAITGCDSIDQVRIVRATPQYITIYPCDGDVVVINKQRITTDSTITEVFPRSGGGDSVVIKTVSFIRPVYHTQTKELYPNQPIQWREKTITTYGTYRDTVLSQLTNPDGLHCDSIYYTLVVTSPHIPAKDSVIYVCSDNLPFTHHGAGHYYPTQDTTIMDTLRNELGDDTLYIYNLYKLVRIYSDTVRYKLCQGDSLQIGNQVYNEGGYYTQRYRRATDNQDSIYRFSIQILPKYEHTMPIGTGNDCDSIQYRNYVFKYQAGYDTGYVYTETLRSTDGCDSIVHLKMTIHRSKQNKLDVTYPKGDKFLYNGKEYSTDTTDDRRFTSRQGCDSLEYLTVRFYNSDDKRYNFLACGGDTIYVLDKPIKVPTNKKEIWINDTTTDQEITYIKRIHIKIGNPFLVARNPERSDKDVRTGKEATFHVSYSTSSPTNSLPDYYDVHFVDNDLEVLPEDSTYPISDTSSLYPITMKLKDNGCIYPGKYTYTITFRSSACLRCNVTDTNTIWVYYPSDIMYAKWDHFVALTKHSESTQCDWDLVPPFRWFINGQEFVSEADPNQLFFISSHLTTNDQITVWASRRTYPVPVPAYSMTFVAQQSLIGTNGKPQIIVAPTAVAKRGAVHVKTEMNGTWRLYNPTGNPCMAGNLDEGINTFLTPGATGCYLLQITLQDGTTTTQRLIVH